MDRIKLERGSIMLVDDSRTLRVGSYRKSALGYEVRLGWPAAGQVMGCQYLREIAPHGRIPKLWGEPASLTTSPTCPG
jgi:hypothetical protein